MSVGLVTATRAGREAADQLSQRWADTATYPVADLARAWAECDQLVCFLAVGATVRLLAPLLKDKHRDPGVVCVDEARQFAVAVLGGHAGGANELACKVADALGGSPVLTTATDAVGQTALDQIGLPLEGDVAAITRELLDGGEVTLTCEQPWPLPPLPLLASPTPRAPAVVLSDRLLDLPSPSVVVRPPSLVAGVGASSGVAAAEVFDLLAAAAAEAGVSLSCLARLATVEAKRDEPGIVSCARRLGVAVVAYPASELARVAVPNPSAAVRAAVGTASVAEAAALVEGGELVVSKRKSAMATVALARLRPRGRLAIVGLGPGARDLLAPRAVAELRRSAHVIGLDQYLDQVRDLLRPGTRVAAFGLGEEQERVAMAVSLAGQGQAVALVGSGDAGIYALASPALERCDGSFDVVCIPGITAMLAAGALLGAPLGHDHAAISLSDLHTPWQVIEARVRAAARADFVVALYNPRSTGRDWQLPKALAILAEHRPASTPVGVVTDASRSGELVTCSSLGEVDPAAVGMRSIVIVGSTSSRVVAGRFVTPRGYSW
ncbi:MAG: precorrin-3B C(17)-methyltransferase [Mycobacteriales bacterium]